MPNQFEGRVLDRNFSCMVGLSMFLVRSLSNRGRLYRAVSLQNVNSHFHISFWAKSAMPLSFLHKESHWGSLSIQGTCIVFPSHRHSLHQHSISRYPIQQSFLFDQFPLFFLCFPYCPPKAQGTCWTCCWSRCYCCHLLC